MMDTGLGQAVEAMGKLEGTAWISDDVVFALLRRLPRRHPSVGLVDSLNLWARRTTRLRDRLRSELLDRDHVLMPVCLSRHWLLFRWSGVANVLERFDPMRGVVG